MVARIPSGTPAVKGALFRAVTLPSPAAATSLPAIPAGRFARNLKGVSVDPGTALALIVGYIAAAIGVFLLYSPVLFLVVGLLLAAGLLQLIAWPFLVLIRKLRRKAEPPQDGSWLLH